MRFYHTLWTAPLKAEVIANNIANFTLSAAFIKQHGGELVLHTDDFGYALLNHIPYDSFYIDLNGLDTNIGNYFWAYGKLYATSKEPIGSIHIDGDVFLQNKGLFKAFENNENIDIVVQSQEDEQTIKNDCYVLTQNVYSKFNLPNNLLCNWGYAYNCGIVQINNKELKTKYLKNYFDTVKVLMKDENLPYYIAEENNKGNGEVIMDIVAEQQFLHQLCNYENYSVRKILYEDNLYSQANNIGYCHLCGPEKYKQYENIISTLKHTDMLLYSKMISKTLYKEYDKKRLIL